MVSSKSEREKEESVIYKEIMERNNQCNRIDNGAKTNNCEEFLLSAKNDYNAHVYEAYISLSKEDDNGIYMRLLIVCFWLLCFWTYITYAPIYKFQIP